MQETRPGYVLNSKAKLHSSCIYMQAHRVALSGPQGGIYSLVESPVGSHIPSVFPLTVTRSPIPPSQYFRHPAAVQVLLIAGHAPKWRMISYAYLK